MCVWGGGGMGGGDLRQPSPVMCKSHAMITPVTSFSS